MSGSLNMVQLIGNLGADPEIRSLNSGDRVANLRIATSERWTDGSGEKKERTEWHRVVIFNDALVRVVEQYAKKGTKIYVQGKIQTRKWTDQAGVEKYATEVVLQKFNSQLSLLSSSGGGDGGEQGYDEGGHSRYGQREAHQGGGGFSGGERHDTSGAPREDFSADLDDEIPF